MRHVTLLFLLACFQYHLSFSQCDDYIVKGSQIFHANDIRTVINTGGDMFWNLEEARFQVPFENANTPSAIFAAAVWIGGYDEVGNLKLAAQTHRSDLITQQEFLPGPLVHFGLPFDPECEHWDTIWSVSRFEILRHILDYELDGVVDNLQKSIFGWPGTMNSFFEELNGFGMPDYPQGYAPFHDKDNDGVYEPQEGEYPLPHGLPADAIPDQITWHIFNDARTHHHSKGNPLQVEVLQTTYAFYCDEASVLDATLFTDFEVVNRSLNNIDSMFFGLWMDPDLGCYTDDYIGSSPDNNGFFVYNEDALDGTIGLECDLGVPGYQEGPPVLSGCFINQEMSSFMIYSNGSFGNPPPPITDPLMPIEFYRVLTGSWRDGAPLCEGGTGYNPGPGCEPADFAFNGDPNDAESWAMTNTNPGVADRRFVASSEIGFLNPGERRSFKMAFTLHLDPERDHLENVELMYEELPSLKGIVENGFIQCEKLTTDCLDDCVWPGDANNDGIANHYDILQLGLAHGKSGPERIAPITWAPHQGDPWSESFANGLNVKFADMNGDGVVGYGKELDVLEVHYGNTHGGYQEVLSCTEGNALIVEGGFELYEPSYFRTMTRVSLNPDVIDSLYGIAFTVVYDTAYFIRLASNLTESPFEMVSEFVNLEKPGVIEYVATRSDGINQKIFEEPLLLRFLFLYNNIDQKPNQHDTTEVCISNIRGTLADGTEIPMGANKIQFIFLDDVSDVSDVSMQGISVYPNPSTGTMHFEVPSDLIGTEYEIRQISGQVYSSNTITNEVTQLDLPAGIYVLAIRGQDRQYVEKIVVLD